MKTPKPTPYVVTVHDIIDRKAEPLPTVKPGHEYSRHTSENAARKAAKSAARGCIMAGPSNVAVLTGPDGLHEVWFKGISETRSGRDITLQTTAYQHKRGIAIVDPVSTEPE